MKPWIEQGLKQWTNEALNKARDKVTNRKKYGLIQWARNTAIERKRGGK